MVDFERFINTVDPLLKPGRDAMWILAGRTESRLPNTNKALVKLKLRVEVFYHCYNTRHMSKCWLLAEAAGHCQFEEHRAGFVCLQGQGAQGHP